MRSALKFLLPALAASLTLAACGSSSSKSSSSSPAAASAATTSSSSAGEGTAAVVKTASNSTLGATVLTNAQGMTLYSLSGEQKGKFICKSSTCTQAWHPVRASAAGTPSGSVGSLGTVKRPDGTEQVTYKGMPLYTFLLDRAPGDARGQGLKDVGTWTAVTTSAKSSSAPAAATPATTPAKPAPAPAQSAPPASSSGGSGGYGY
jgi:predicted lipoprotein with Yx(FWY)xxD motif